MTLPFRPIDPAETPVAFAPGRSGTPTPVTRLRDGRVARGVSFDHITGLATFTTIGEGGVFGEGVVRWDEIGTALSHDLTRRLTIVDGDPLSAEATIEQSYTMLRDDWVIRIDTSLVMTGDAENFRLTGTLKAYEGDELAATRSWSETIPRVHV